MPADGLKDKAAAAKRGYTQRLVAPASGQQAGQGSAHQGDPVLVLVGTADAVLAAILARHPVKNYTPPS